MKKSKIELELLKQISEHLNFNDLMHTLGVAEAARKLGRKYHLSQKDNEQLLLDAYLHDYSKREGDICTHHLTSAIAAKAILDNLGYENANYVSDDIRAHSFPIQFFRKEGIEFPKPASLIQLLLIMADLTEVTSAAGTARTFANNVARKLSFEDNLKDVDFTMIETKKNLEWVLTEIKAFQSR